MLYVLRGFRLVRRVLIQERSLQLVLQVRVGRELESLLVATLRIELDKVTCDVLDALLRAFLQSVPRTRAKSAEAWRFAGVGAAVFGYLVERMY